MSACEDCGRPLILIAVRRDSFALIRDVLAIGEYKGLSKNEFALMLILAASSLGLSRGQITELVDELPNRVSDEIEEGELIEMPSHVAVHELSVEFTCEDPDAN